MAIVIRFLSGALEGREFKFEEESVRIGDSPDADVKLEDGGARGRVVEVHREGGGFRIRSIGDRELSAQQGLPLDRLAEPGEEVRFGAWGPIFKVESREIRSAGTDTGMAATAPFVTSPLAPAPAASQPKEARTGPIPKPVMGEDPAVKKPEKTVLPPAVPGEKPIGIKTINMMIQDALGKVRESDAGVMEKSTTFIRELVSDTMRSGTRNLKIGLGLLAAAFAILFGALVYNMAATTRSIEEVSKSTQQTVEAAKSETANKFQEIEQAKEKLAKETEAVTQRLSVVEKDSSAGQAEIEALRTRLKDAERDRKALEEKLSQFLTAAQKDRESMSKKLEKLEKDQADAKTRAEAEEKRRREEAAHEAAEKAKAAAAAPPPATVAPQPR